MKKIKFLAPYKPNGRTRYPDTLKRAGVYLIRENGKLVYVGMSTNNLYKTLYRHFQTWNDRSHPRITYQNPRKKYTVRVILCTPKQAERLEKALILKHQPRDNGIKYDNYKLEFYDKQVLEQYEAAPVENCPF